jgi:hypothetical protein
LRKRPSRWCGMANSCTTFNKASAGFTRDVHTLCTPHLKGAGQGSEARRATGAQKRRPAGIAGLTETWAEKSFYCSASIRRVMVRFNSLSERRSSSILLME